MSARNVRRAPDAARPAGSRSPGRAPLAGPGLTARQGFVVFDYADRYAEAAVELGGWLREGKLRSREDVVRGGVADFPDTLLRLFRGDNTGKLILQISG